MDLNSKRIIDILKDIPKRFVLMISKFIGVKGVIWGAATALLYFEKIETWAWVAVSIVVIFGREALKFFKDIR